MKEDRIWKYIIGEGDDEDRLKTILWIKADAERSKEYHRLNRNMALSGVSAHISDDKLEKVYQKCKQEIGIAPGQFKKYLFEVTKYAAVIFITLTLGWFLFPDRNVSDSGVDSELAFVTVENLPGQSTKTTLPDGTIIWLNGDSKLSYSTQFFAEEDRDVNLSGEAYFDVTHDASKPFQVMTDDVIVKVLGTSFNVEAFPDEDVVTTLVEGKVEINNLEGEYLTDLSSGQQVVYSKEDQRIIKRKVDTEYYASWKDGYITFNNFRLEDLAPRLERFYNIEIVFKNQASKDLKISGRALRNVPVDQLFQVLEMAFGLRYDIKPSLEGPSQIIVKK